MNLLKKGTVVKYDKGYYRISRLTKKTVNLKSVWGNKIYYKGLPKSDVVEAEAEWYEHWSNSETYRSM
jgi:hypothetical protein